MLSRLVDDGDDVPGAADAADAAEAEIADQAKTDLGVIHAVAVAAAAPAVGCGRVLAQNDVLLGVSLQWNGEG